MKLKKWLISLITLVSLFVLGGLLNQNTHASYRIHSMPARYCHYYSGYHDEDNNYTSFERLSIHKHVVYYSYDYGHDFYSTKFKRLNNGWIGIYAPAGIMFEVKKTNWGTIQVRVYDYSWDDYLMSFQASTNHYYRWKYNRYLNEYKHEIKSDIKNHDHSAYKDDKSYYDYVKKMSRKGLDNIKFNMGVLDYNH